MLQIVTSELRNPAGKGLLKPLLVSGNDTNVWITGNIDYCGICPECAFHTADACRTTTASGAWAEDQAVRENADGRHSFGRFPSTHCCIFSTLAEGSGHVSLHRYRAGGAGMAVILGFCGIQEERVNVSFSQKPKLPQWG